MTREKLVCILCGGEGADVCSVICDPCADAPGHLKAEVERLTREAEAWRLKAAEEEKWGMLWRDAVAASDVLRGKLEVVERERDEQRDGLAAQTTNLLNATDAILRWKARAEAAEAQVVALRSIVEEFVRDVWSVYRDTDASPPLVVTLTEGEVKVKVSREDEPEAETEE
jgi:hypothetical protein